MTNSWNIQTILMVLVYITPFSLIPTKYYVLSKMVRLL